MQFISGGPEIPGGLLQAHEEGDVVFFCGAGISLPEGLPSFPELTTALFDRAGVIPDTQQKNAIKLEQLDRAIDLLERRTAGGRRTVRQHLPDLLCPANLRHKVAPTHTALLALATSKVGKVRLVTTNFDRLFENVCIYEDRVVEPFYAPLLPVPKSKLNGLVYLHGLIRENPTDEELDQLILSSGDFGRAYLTERWASQFVTDLFKKFTVCFVGYSINDPVLRYLMDAFAADKLDGEPATQAYAFAGYKEGERKNVMNEWDAKNVVPILYRYKDRDHTALHSTLQAWADYHREGIRGKEQFVTKYASLKPMLSTAEDNFVGRVLWAISDTTGIPAKCFADLDPPPPIEWLDVILEQSINADLLPTDHNQKEEDDTYNRYNLLSRPHSSYPGAWTSPLLPLWASPLDRIAEHLSKWLCRHLENPKLLYWIQNSGGRLHHRFRKMIEVRLHKLPKEIQVYWSLILAGRCAHPTPEYSFFDWESRYRKEGMHLGLTEEFCQIYSPRVRLNPSFKDNRIPTNSPLDSQILLGLLEPHYSLSQLRNIPGWKGDLPKLLEKASSLLLDALNIMQELGKADELKDLSYISQPYIHDSKQNHRYQDWTALIELTRDAWLEAAQISPTKASLTAQSWYNQAFPVFKRLAFFAATHTKVVAPKMALAWLTMDDQRWLWSVETQPEVLRLILAIAPELSKNQWNKLEKLILKGPPKFLYSDNLNGGEWARIVDYSIAVRLAKAKASKVLLCAKAQAKLDEISKKYPKWDLYDEAFETSVRFSYGGGSPFAKKPVPQSVSELVDWLLKHPAPEWGEEDEWQDICENNLDLSLQVLSKLSQMNQWLPYRWKEALSGWYKDKELTARSWEKVSALLTSAPDKLIKEISHSLSWYLDRAAAALLIEEKEQFTTICCKILESEISHSWVCSKDQIHSAINHTLGITAQAVIKWVFKDNPSDCQGIKEPMRTLLTKLCDMQIDSYRYARLQLASNSIALFRLDPDWTKVNLLPLFSWTQVQVEVVNTWVGFLSAARDYLPLLEELKAEFLATSAHLNQIGEYAESYASLLTWVSLQPQDSFSNSELQEASANLGKEGLCASLGTIRSFLMSFEANGSTTQKENFWKNRVEPYFQKIWPKAKALIIDPRISDILAEICILADNQFSEAFKLMKSWLVKTTSCEIAIHRLSGSKICSKFPAESLEFLDHIVSNSLSNLKRDLSLCLDEILESESTFASDARFKRLDTIAKKQKL
ncbi:anti-phage defense-associated sirtuin Dsr1 [Estrella lausannensis]|uniref:Uncharacterized protein n=1 Tax=Estrella lausannensis TaxID=483423 RepID=A0A0H5DQ41_9BACT|nr:anti-phage defense-associated sirtuin Dsr1 [Estrella lausannensis]CRX38602.1 hypothetical protein ELAC_1261 [Estrella lausannensis]